MAPRRIKDTTPTLKQRFNEFVKTAVPIFHYAFVPTVIIVGMLKTSPRPPITALLSPM
jgi:TOM7 family